MKQKSPRPLRQPAASPRRERRSKNAYRNQGGGRVSKGTSALGELEDQDELNHWLLAQGFPPITVQAISFPMDEGPDAVTTIVVYKFDNGMPELDEASGEPIMDEREGLAMQSLPLWCIAPDDDPEEGDDEDD